jgi:hypothetical protein
MNMKKFLYFIIAFLTSSLFFMGCSEDFLNKKPIGEESTGTFYGTQEGCEMAVTACYAVLITRFGFSRDYWAFGDVASDDSEAGGERGGADQGACQRIDQWQVVPGNSYLTEFYSDMYQAVYRCNVAIEGIPQGDIDQSIKDRLIAEARFLRAFYLFQLNNVYGGVRIIDHVLLPEEYDGSRNTVAEVLHFVQSEMSAAASALPAEYSASNFGRATKGAALAYRLKALAFESSYAQVATAGHDPANFFEGCTNKWANAAQVFDSIEALGVYELEPNYDDLWPVAGEYSKEYIFTGHSVSLQAGSGIEDINQRLLGGVQCAYQSCRSYFNADDSLILNGRAGLYGLNCPTYDLFNDYETGDSRMVSTITRDGDSLWVMEAHQAVYLTAAPSGASPTRMNNKKYDPFLSEWIDPVLHFGPRDLKFMRYADIILLAAEAAFNTGDEPTARTLVNRIRERARNSGTTSIPANFTSAITLADIQHERRVELAMEAHRYFDIVRWGIAKDRLNGTYRATDTIANPNAPPISWVEGKNEFFPIPESEIAQNRGEMLQNPNY